MVALYDEVANLSAGIKRYPDKLPNILIVGEPGTGKELLARAIHEFSGRQKDAFKQINCANFSDELLQSEVGILEEANKGTVQLDEIYKMPGFLQAKLFRILWEKQIRRVGSNDHITY